MIYLQMVSLISMSQAYLPSSSTSAGAVPALRASSNSFFFFQSSLVSFWPKAAPEDAPVDDMLMTLK